MTAGKNESKTDATGQTAVGRRGKSSEGEPQIGWGFGPDEQEDFFLRKWVFSVLFAVLACVGGWFMYLTVRGSGRVEPILSARGEQPATARYTVKLLEMAPEKRPVAERLAATREISALAGGSRFRFIDLPDGRIALCVGEFDRADSPQMALLLQRFRAFTAGGTRLFEDASVYRLP